MTDETTPKVLAPGTEVEVAAEVAEYIQDLHAKVDELETALEGEGFGGEAPAQVSARLYGKKNAKDDAGQSRSYQVEFTFTARGHGYQEAWSLMISGISYAEEELKLKLYPDPSLLQTAATKAPKPTESNGSDPAGNGQQESGGRSRSRTAARSRSRSRSRAPAGAQEEDPTGDDETGIQWYITKSLMLDKTEGGDTFIQCRSVEPKYGRHGLRAYLDSAKVPADVRKWIESGDWQYKEKIEGDELKQDFHDMAMFAADLGAKKVVAFTDLGGPR